MLMDYTWEVKRERKMEGGNEKRKKRVEGREGSTVKGIRKQRENAFSSHFWLLW